MPFDDEESQDSRDYLDGQPGVTKGKNGYFIDLETADPKLIARARGEISAPEPEPLFKKPSMLETMVPPMYALNTAGRAFQREEAAVAEPLLMMLSKFDQGAPENDHTPLLQEFMGSVGRGLKGEPSELTESGFRPAELGDVGRKGFSMLRDRGFDVPEELSGPLSAGGGLLASMALPSTLALNAAGQIGKKTAKITKQLAGTRDFLNMFKELRDSKGMLPKAVAEVMERGSGVKSDVVLYAFEHPEILTKNNAAPERAQKLGQDIANRVSQITAKNPSAFGVDEKVPLEIAQGMTDNFDTLIGDAGQALNNLKKQFGRDQRRVNVAEIEAGINKILREKHYVDKSGNILKPHLKNPTAMYLSDLRDSLYEFGEGKFGRLNLDDLEGFKEIVRRKAFDAGAVDAAGIRRPDPDMDRLGKLVYRNITDSVRAHYPSNLVSAYETYSNLADSRGRMSRKFGTNEKLARFLRALDRKDPEQMQEFAELVTNIPDGDKYLQDTTRFLDAKANSLEGLFPWLGSRNKSEIAAEVESLMKKDYFSNEFGLDKKVGLQKLGQTLGVDLTKDYVNHYVANTFSKKANLIRNLTGAFLGGAGAFATSGLSLPAGAMLGWMLTDPKAQGKAISMYSKVKGSGVTRSMLGALEKSKPVLTRKFISEFENMGDEE